MKNLFTLVLACTLLSACGGNKHDSFLGKYEYTNNFDKSQKILEVSKDGDAFLLNFDLTKKNDFRPLTKTKDSLQYNGDAVSLSADKNTIYIRKINAKRVSDEYATTFLNKVIADKKLCKELDAEAKQSSKQIKDSAAWDAYRAELQNRKPNGCILVNDGARFF